MYRFRVLRIEIDLFIVDFCFSAAYWVTRVSKAEEQREYEEWLNRMLTRVEIFDSIVEEKAKPKPKPKPKTPAKPKPKPAKKKK